MDTGSFLLVALAGLAAGAINAAVGSGTLLTYPTLLAVGIPPVAANGTNTAGLSPGSLSSAWAYRAEVRDRLAILRRPLVAMVVGGVVGATLVVTMPAKVFTTIVPWLVAAATVLVALQPVIARAVSGHPHERHHRLWAWTGAVGIYSGYFGAAQGVMLMAVLGIAYDADPQRANGAKNLLAGAANLAAAVVFVISGAVVWWAVLALMVGSVPGGYVGGRLARRLPRPVLRALVVCIGVGATVYLVLHH